MWRLQRPALDLNRQAKQQHKLVETLISTTMNENLPNLLSVSLTTIEFKNQ